MKKLVVQLVSVALVGATIATTAWGATPDTLNPLKNLYQWVDPSDLEGKTATTGTDFKYTGSPFTDKQVKLLEDMSYDVKGLGVTKDGVTIEPIKVIGDRNFAYTIFEVTANDGRKLDGGIYYFFLDELDDLGYSTFWPAEPPQGAVGGDLNVAIMKDENPRDNKLWLITKTDITNWAMTTDITTYSANNVGKNLYYHIPKLVEVYGSNSDAEGKRLATPPGDPVIAANASVVATGPWTFSIPIQYKDTTKKYTFNKTVKEKSGNQTIEYRIDSVEISPMSLVIRGVKEPVYRGTIPVSLKKKDGTVTKLEVYGGYRDNNLRATCIFKAPIDVTEIQSVIIADTDFPLQ